MPSFLCTTSWDIIDVLNSVKFTQAQLQIKRDRSKTFYRG